jgi:ubiquitin-conjugating enzyme E2 G1
MSKKSAIAILNKQYKQLNKNPIQGFFVGIKDNNILNWEGTLMGPEDTLYEEGIFSFNILFPDNYPLLPPKFIFKTPIFHPNIYENGSVCISILHNPGDDAMGYEDASDRWRPVHTVESIVLSIISLLSSPNDESPANIEAAKLLRTNKKEYKKLVREYVRKSQES